jgi:hypothetical protein
MRHLLQAIWVQCTQPGFTKISCFPLSLSSLAGLLQNSSCKAQIDSESKKEKEKTLRYLKPICNITCQKFQRISHQRERSRNGSVALRQQQSASRGKMKKMSAKL